MMSLLEMIEKAIENGDAAFRVSGVMQPVEGKGSTIFPPTYLTEDSARTKYAVEGPIPLFEGQKPNQIDHYRRALLMSVAQGARALQAGLQDLIDEGRLKLPNIVLDFTQVLNQREEADLAYLGTMSTLNVPHRVYDAIFRDSLITYYDEDSNEEKETLFRLSPQGRKITDSSQADATGIYNYAPTVLLFGGWDSTGPKGGLGAKFERAIYAEIVANDVYLGVKVGSRIDPLQIQSAAGVIYQAEETDQIWVLNEAEAKKKGTTVLLYESKGKGKGKPSAINHGNVAPSIDHKAGGIVMDHATLKLVLSLGSIRKLRFSTLPDGTPILKNKTEINRAGQTVITALGLVAMAAYMKRDFALRSRCHLIIENKEDWTVHKVGRWSDDLEPIELTVNNTLEAFNQAVEKAQKLGLTWNVEMPLLLTPSPKLLTLVRNSRDIVIDQEEMDGE